MEEMTMVLRTVDESAVRDGEAEHTARRTAAGLGAAPAAISTWPRGMDISHYQPNIDWSTVANDGLSFAFAKATEGTGYVDPSFASHWAGMKQSGLLRGAYHFYRANEDPIAQADHFLKHVPSLGKGDLHPMLDVETTDGQNAATIINGVQKWINYVKGSLHRDVIIYTYVYFWLHNMNNTNQFASTCPLWIASYVAGTKPVLVGGWPFWTFWQYTSNGHVNGVSSVVDLDRFNGPVANLRKFAGY
jgi:lysozyme